MIDKGKVKEQFDLRDVMSRYLDVMKSRGKSHKYFCPFHHDTKNPNFTVYEDRYVCFACGERGDIFSTIMHFEKVTFPQAVHMLAKECGIVDDGHSFTRRELFLKLNREEYEKFQLRIQDMRKLAESSHRDHDQTMRIRSQEILERLRYILSQTQNKRLKDATERLIEEYQTLYTKSLMAI